MDSAAGDATGSGIVQSAACPCLVAGRLAVIDFREGQSPLVMASAKYTQAELESWATEAGFRKLATHDFLGNNFLAVFGVD